MNEVDIRALEEVYDLIVSHYGGNSYPGRIIKAEITRLKAEQAIDSPDRNPTSPTNVAQKLEEDKQK